MFILPYLLYGTMAAKTLGIRAAMQMILYPIEFWSLPIKRWVLGSIYDCSILQPLGVLGWQVKRPLFDGAFLIMALSFTSHAPCDGRSFAGNRPGQGGTNVF